MQTTTTKTEIAKAVSLTAALAETVREAGRDGAPEGPLYAAMLGVTTFDGFKACVGVLVRAGLVERRADVLFWIGPEVAS